MKTLTVLNPAAGNGYSAAGKVESPDYLTTGTNDCRRYVCEICRKTPETHFNICGGDGTINEAVSGIMDAGAGKSATITAIPCGSGNDTVKTTNLNPTGSIVPVDLIRCNDVYCINMLNIGFDCNVVADASHFKNKYKIAGKLSYILGVFKEFFKPFGEPFKIDAECVDGSTYSFDGSAMLCAICNGQWCGGSFHNSPASDMSDGVIEVILAKKLGRIKFLQMIGKYKNGTLINKDGKVIERFADKIDYIRIKSMTISGCKQICADGEIFPCTKASISIIPEAIRYQVG